VLVKIAVPVTSEPHRIVGIDLGTTHTVAAYAADGVATVLPVPQLVARGEVAARPQLPSFLFADEQADVALDEPPWICGEYARTRGIEVPTGLVASAKSWLCHAGVDRLAPVLPWGAAGDAPKLSPVEASRRLLSHVRRAHDAAFPKAPLRGSQVVLTVPASFDQVARTLTLRAAREAGLRVRLLEEPQAAVYDYLGRGGAEQLAARIGDDGETLVLVCDVGGGTTDLTLLRARLDAAGALDIERVAVGKHLLLGGDNMDLALAHATEARLGAPERLDPVRFAQLVMACRAAKERLLGPAPPTSVPIRVLSRGTSLVGGTLATELARADLESIVLDGFFPRVDRSARASRGGAALVGFGLPYERDPAVTRHLAAFFARHAQAAAQSPLCVLLNGGIFRSAAITERLVEVIGTWTDRSVTRLGDVDPDLAVARGAVRYGLALEGQGLRITAGSARGYYVGIGERSRRGARALCVVPRGAREGVRSRVAAEGLSVLVGQPVRFDLYASDEALDEAGTVVDVERAELEPLPPMATTLGSARSKGTAVPVELEGELTSVGTLEIACTEPGGDGRRYQLAFELRAEPERVEAPPQSRRALANLDDARDIARRALGSTVDQTRPIKDALRDLERILGERSVWPTDVTRALFDVVTEDVKLRRRSMDHERVFWMLAGFCLRPGYGYPGDERRVARVAKLFSEGVTFKDENRVWQQFFIAWRRIAGGLHERTQVQIRSVVDPFLAPEEERLKKPKGFRPRAPDEMLEMASMLERVSAADRARLGGWLIERTWTSRDPRLWSAIGRLGARVPAYASAHHVVPTRTVEDWLDHLLRERWDDVPTAARSAFWMARRTGDRARDVSDALRARVAERLEAADRGEWAHAVREVVAMGDRDRAEIFGEALPAGLRLDEPSA
jgi:molecular chaperone DnaK (HSP70)